MVPDCLIIIFNQFSLLYVGPALVLYTINRSRVPKSLQLVLPLLNLLLLTLFLISSFPILIWLTVKYFMIQKKTKSSSPSNVSPPSIIITPTTQDHITNLPPSVKEQNQNFLTAYPQSRPRRRKKPLCASSFEPGSLADLVHRVVCSCTSRKMNI
ncbi:uncharacterized protein MELLADRAFT_124337 [Melampsora larici-populina 98AG31]|uniref:Secreted protein n=1 Tax=Melampsora larici-populina (strain 98AG31 / pathotype 3-4-7) TaxID=747676 RepID=F4RIX6_MELLP|nr:uncharacterized protein MELLADRAFT_124337 [Melampsora larici-populina 98AG31]EGG07756.1 secreted protein [Melampsora larici-populina 98AG31]